jgi:hypothetical protein
MNLLVKYNHDLTIIMGPSLAVAESVGLLESQYQT